MIEATHHFAIDFAIPIAVSIAIPGYILTWFIFPIWLAYDFFRFLNWRLRQPL